MNHTLFNDSISASVSAAGAEKTRRGWSYYGRPVRSGHATAPILFPIVGRLKNDELRHRGKLYPMTRHGFARDRKALGGYECACPTEERLKTGYRALNPKPIKGAQGRRG
jgi:hypothetical protein